MMCIYIYLPPVFTQFNSTFGKCNVIYLRLKMRKSLSCLFRELGVIPISEEADIHIYEIDIYIKTQKTNQTIT